MRKLHSKMIVLVLVLVLAAAFAGCNDSGGGDESGGGGGNTYVNIGTGGTAGTYYPLGGAMAEIWQNNIDGVIASAESTGASVANVNMLGEGELEVIIIQNDIAYYALDGVDMNDLFKERTDNLRGMACLYSEPLQCITTDPSIKSVADLAGKRVAVGAIGSGVYANVTQILDAAGLTEDDLGEKHNLSFAEAATSLKDRQIDAAFIVAGVPTSAVVDLSTQRDVYLVPIDGEVGDNLKAAYSYYTDFTIPAGTYSGQEEDVQTLTVQSMLGVSSSVSDDLVYDMLDAMFNNLDRIRAAHSVGEFISVESALEGMSIELHPGAARYFEDKGISR